MWTSGTLADGAGATATINTNIIANQTITIDTTARTLGILNLGDTNASNPWTIAASGGGALAPGSGSWKNGAADGQWTTNTGTNNNWVTGYPSAAGQTATFDDSVTGGVAGIVDLNGSKTVGAINLSTTTAGGYTLGLAATANTLTLQVSSGAASIAVSGNASHTIAAPVITASDTNVSVVGSASLNLAGGITNNTNTLTLSNTSTGSLNAGAITGTGIGSTVVSSGTASATSITQNSLSIGTSAVLKITPTNTPNTAASTSVLSSLTIAGSTGNWSGQLDMGNNSLVIKNGGAAVLGTVADEIRQGMGLSTTIDPGHHGITSSTALANSNGDTTLGYAVASDIQPTGTFAFAGQTVGGNDVLVKYTWKADANLDGIVNVADLGLLATYYGRGTSPSQPLLSFQDAMAMFPQFGGTGSVPEPTRLGLLGLGAVGLLARRRR